MRIVLSRTYREPRGQTIGKALTMVNPWLKSCYLVMPERRQNGRYERAADDAPYPETDLAS